MATACTRQSPKQWKPADAADSLAAQSRSRLAQRQLERSRVSAQRARPQPENKQTQFADFNGHGWVYRAVYKHDRKGNWLDKDDHKVDFNDPEEVREGRPPQPTSTSIRACTASTATSSRTATATATCTAKPRAAVEIDCVDCHGSVRARATLKTSNTAAPDGGHDLARLRTPFGTRRFEWVARQTDAALHGGGESGMDRLAGARFRSRPGSYNYNEKARLAKTMQRDGATWG